MRRLFLVRHGVTDWNEARRLQGASDIPLNDRGRDQARDAAPLLARIAPVQTIVASDLSRAQETAHIIAAAMGATVVTDDRLRERSYGAWEGLHEDVRRSEHAVEHARWERGLEPRVAGYEGHDAVARRAIAAVDELVTAEGNHMFVGHGSTFRVLVCALLGMALDSRAIATLGNVRWAELESATADNAPGHWVLREHNSAGDTVYA